MQNLTAQYLDDHLIGVHTYDSFGRSVADLILQTAKKQLADSPDAGAKGLVNFSVDVSVTAVSLTECVGIEIRTPLGKRTIHVNVPDRIPRMGDRG